MLGILLIYSCKKEIGSLFNNPDEPNALEWAREYYTRHLQKQNGFSVKLPSGKGTSAAVDLKNNRKTPIWAGATQAVTDLYTLVEVPLKYEHRITPTLAISKNPYQRPVADKEVIDASFDRLIIYRDKKGNMGQRIISYIPDVDYLRKHHGDISHNRLDKVDRDFFGYVHYKDWEGNALFAIRVENGKAVKRYGLEAGTRISIDKLDQPAKTSGSKVMVLPGNDPDCTYIVTWDWYQDCYYASEASTIPIYCDPVVVYNVQSVLVSCNPEGGGGNNDPEPGCPGLLLVETGECIIDPVTPCDFVKEATKNPKFNLRMDSLAANVSGNTEKAYAINYATNYSKYAEGAVNDPYVSLGIGAPIDFYGHNHFGSGLKIFSPYDLKVLRVLDSAGLINNYQSFTFAVATSYGQYVLAIENKTQFQSFLSSNFSTIAAFETWGLDYQDLADKNITDFSKPVGEAWELAFLEKIAGHGMKLFKKDNLGIFKPIKKDPSSLSIVNDFCN